MEQYYRVPIEPLPTLQFSCSHSSEYNRLDNSGENGPLLEINCVTAGSVRLLQGQRQESYSQEQVYLLSTEQSAETVFADEDFQEYSCGLLFPGSAAIVDAREIAVMRYRSDIAILPMRITEPNICRQVYHLLTAIDAHRWDAADPVYRLMMDARLYELLALLTRYSLQRTRRQQFLSTQKQNPHCRRACLYIQDHLSTKIRVEAVARFVGVGYRQLSALFVKHMGTTLVDYINAEKIRRVRDLILLEGASLETAGEAVGIQNTKYLSTLFRKHTGMTVREYKKLHRNSGGILE